MKLREYLSANKLSKTSFAQAIGVSRQTLHLYLNDVRLPRRAVLERIHQETSDAVTANDFIGLPSRSNDGAHA